MKLRLFLSSKLMIKMCLVFYVLSCVQGNSNTIEKMLFIYKYNKVNDPETNKLYVFDYKNIAISEDQLTIFESPNPGESVKY